MDCGSGKFVLDDVSRLGRASLGGGNRQGLCVALGRKSIRTRQNAVNLTSWGQRWRKFSRREENILRIYLRIRHTTANGVESL